jgi:uncharacterized membrane protein
MRRPFFALPLLLAAGCQTPAIDGLAVQSVRYQAMGQEPFWQLVIGDDHIWFREGDNLWGGWPRTLPRTVGRVFTWRSGEGDSSVTIEARPGPCTNENGQVFRDFVTVRFTGTSVTLSDDAPPRPYDRTLTGCGGRLERP